MIRTWARLCSVVVVAAAIVAATTGCTQEAEVDTNEAFRSQAESVLATADGQGAGTAQLDLLRSAIEQGEVTFETYQTAVEASFSCMRETGLVVDEGGVDTSEGYKLIVYGYGGGTNFTIDEAGEIGDECLFEHSYFVELLYQTQPTSLEAMDAAFEAARPQVYSCLKDLGLDVTEDMSRQELSNVIGSVGSSGDEVLMQAAPECWLLALGN